MQIDWQWPKRFSAFAQHLQSHLQRQVNEAHKVRQALEKQESAKCCNFKLLRKGPLALCFLTNFPQADGKVKSVLCMPAEVSRESPTDAYVNDSQSTESRQDSTPLWQDIYLLHIYVYMGFPGRACLVC